MARYFAPITLREFRTKIDDAKEKKISEESGSSGEWNDYWWNQLTPEIHKDLEKVQFDMENVSTTDTYGWKTNKDLLGYQELDNGMMLLGVNAGGDWEKAIYFCIYWDGKQLRAYIPTEGNTWNTLNKVAVGNDDECDEKFIAKYPGKGELDYGLLVNDIKHRILPKP